MEILAEANARLRAMIAQNEDADLEHKIVHTCSDDIDSTRPNEITLGGSHE
jgi:hypothetical protein